MPAVLIPVFSEAKVAAQRTASISNLKQIGVGFAIYQTDNNERLPLGPHWMDVLQPYVKVEDIYHSPLLGKPADKLYGYCFHEKLKGADARKIQDHSHRALVFDTTLKGRSAVGGLTTLPRPGRYSDQNTMVMMDMSAKAVDPEDTGLMSQIR